MDGTSIDSSIKMLEDSADKIMVVGLLAMVMIQTANDEDHVTVEQRVLIRDRVAKLRRTLEEAIAFMDKEPIR